MFLSGRTQLPFYCGGRVTNKNYNQTCLNKAETDACAQTESTIQTRNLNPNVFETNVFDPGSRRQMLVLRHGTIIHKCLKHSAGNCCVYTDKDPHSKRLKHKMETMLVDNKDHNPNVFGQRAVD